MSEHKDKSPLVEITVHATDILFTNCDYPEPTKEMIIEKMRELLDEGNITYSEKRHPQTSITSAIEKINKEPISSVLETFGDIDNIMSESEKLQEELEPINKDIPQSHTDKIFTSRQTILKGTSIGRASEEQGGNRDKSSYSKDRDPFNE
jgi:tRNA/tmRNA/rRNA uracil-C5-methylase (TrmA/RlmC/RlmD family)|tara:strand:- start:919 stop:1368 length:450 start_codon:yes stop_codon:yes gene_type:complete